MMDLYPESAKKRYTVLVEELAVEKDPSLMPVHGVAANVKKMLNIIGYEFRKASGNLRQTRYQMTLYNVEMVYENLQVKMICHPEEGDAGGARWIEE